MLGLSFETVKRFESFSLPYLVSRTGDCNPVHQLPYREAQDSADQITGYNVSRGTMVRTYILLAKRASAS